MVGGQLYSIGKGFFAGRVHMHASAEIQIITYEGLWHPLDIEIVTIK